LPHDSKGSNASASSRSLNSSVNALGICESRLPRKKRKESNDSAAMDGSQAKEAAGEFRKYSYDTNASSFSDLGLRKGDSMVDGSIRKSSLDANSSSCNSLLLPLPSLEDVSTRSTGLNPTAEAHLMLSDNLDAKVEATVTAPMGEHPSTSVGPLSLPSITTIPDVASGKAMASAPYVDGGPHKAKAAADENSSQDETFASSGHRLLMEAMLMTTTGVGGSNSSKTPAELKTRERLDSTSLRADVARYNSFIGRRDRLESWGGMSDLSVPAASDSILATAVAAATNLHNGLLMEDPEHDLLPSLMPSTSSHEDRKMSGSIPSKISLPPYRDRLGSIASLGDLSVGNFNPNTPLIVDGIDVPGHDLQAFVAAAMASVGDQLVELAGAMEELTGESITSEDLRRELNDEGDSSVASPMIGAISDVAAGRRPRAWSTSSRLSGVDLDAVQAAVDAAYALVPPPDKAEPKSCVPRRTLPLKRGRTDHSATSEEEPIYTKEVAVRGSGKKRSRRSVEASIPLPDAKKGAVAGKNLPPLKKRPLENRKRVSTSSQMQTPKLSNRSMSAVAEPVLSELHIPPAAVLSGGGDEPKSSTLAAGQANQKWEKMYTCLLEFAAERQAVESAKATTTTWDGNVPTNYKTRDGLALGRWVNNQRSAKAKGNLREDREERLIEAGLKWSVVASNSWNEMLEELSIYIQEQHSLGKVWDGNVPTNYQIKSRPDGGFNGEDKNLGRWVNRQRSLHQSGKLRKDRKALLEGVGLKWSMLATTSWEEMYDTLKEYAEEQMKKDGQWDGNVPATYRTNDNPPRALGRWVNRQRSAFAKKKLKQELVDQLNQLGLKWSVHQRHGEEGDFVLGDDDGDDDPGGSGESGKENSEEQKDVSKEEVAVECETMVDSI
jgi:Helicase associated domain